MASAATRTSQQVCPLVTTTFAGPRSHVGGTVLGGDPSVLIGGEPAARVGDPCICVGPDPAIATGSATVLIGGMAAARVGDLTSHGGAITSGVSTVQIGD